MALSKNMIGFAKKLPGCPGGEARQHESWIEQNRTLATVYIGMLLGALLARKVIWLEHDFFLTRIVWFLGKTPQIYPRFQFWGVMDLGFDFQVFHWITTPLYRTGESGKYL